MNNKLFEYQKFNRYFAQVTEGLEILGEEEIKGFGAKKVKAVYKGIYFEASPTQLYRINYQSKFLSRVLAPLKTFDCHSTKYLYSQAKQIDWTTLFDLSQSFSISASVANSKVKHSKYASQCLKDSIVDQFREKYGERPNVDTKNAQIHINLRIFKNKAVISWDTSGGSLHKRGYRKETVEAPMKEYLAAALVHYSKWDGSKKLYDPMCGSGTILSEALMAYCRIPSGYLRKSFGFKFLPDFDEDIWNTVKNDTCRNIRDIPNDILAGSDIEKKVVGIAKANQKNLPNGKSISIIMSDFKKLDNLENCIIVCNPPYGVRLGNYEKMQKLYSELGTFLKKKCKKSTAFLYIGDKKLIPFIGLKPRWEKRIINGDLDGRLIRIDIF